MRLAVPLMGRDGVPHLGDRLWQPCCGKSSGPSARVGLSSVHERHTSFIILFVNTAHVLCWGLCYLFNLLRVWGRGQGTLLYALFHVL